MFLVEDRSIGGVVQYVFLHADPRKQGFEGNVKEGVSLGYDMQHVHAWPYDDRRSSPCLAHDPKNSRVYKVFKNDDERQREGYVLVAAETPSVHNYWKEYTDVRDGAYPSMSN